MKEAALLLLAFASGALIIALAFFFASVAYIAMNASINFIVDRITALFGKGPRAKKPPATDA